jgi:hypothetical protein
VTETFEVGQKVRVSGVAEGEITYGPFPSTYGTFTGYVVRTGETERLQRERDLSAIPETPKFAIGDVVTVRTRGARATVEYGPFDDRDVYVVKLVDEPTDSDDARTFTALASVLKADTEIKVGDRVRVVKDDPEIRTGEYVGEIGTVMDVGNALRDDLNYRIKLPLGRAWWVAEVERVTDEDTYTYDGVTYDLSGQYRDREGDVWRFARIDGTVRGTCDEDGDAPVRVYHATLERIVDDWAPLTRVND